MTVWIAAILLAAAVLGLCKVFGLVAFSRSALSLAQEAFVIISDRALPEEEKEVALQRRAVQLFKLFGLLVVSGAAAVCLPLGGLWVADRLGALSWRDVLATTVSWPFLGGTIVLTAVALAVGRRPPRPTAGPGATGFENRYSAADRWLHQLAFATTPVQVALASAEDRLYRRRLQPASAERPVFITALPRAGTTLLLNLVAGLDGFVTHTYRQMPFVLTPLLWQAFARRFRVEDAPRERAHGDGLLVSVDSPEALEEMLWLAFWEEHYERERIRPWTPAEERPEFVTFFRQHLRKLATLPHHRAAPAAAAPPGPPDAGGPGRARRYVSKNNGNVARLAWLRRTFPEARFVVPFRPPLQHAASLLRQHRNFLAIHARDPFARQYMAGVGHFDFGQNLRPIDFDGWLARRGELASVELEFWFRYWIATYREVVSVADDRVRLLDFDALGAEPEAQLGRLATFLELPDAGALTAQAVSIRPATPHAVDARGVTASVLAEAEALHAELRARAASG